MKHTFLKSSIAIVALVAVTAPAFAHERDGRMGPGRGAGPAMGGAMMMEQFDEFDADGNGAITEEEMQASAKARFDAADTNGDGKLSAEEMTAQREAMKAGREARMQAKMIERLDKDGDGAISFDEAQAGMSESRRDKMFSRLDLDENGSVTKTEIEAMAKRFAGHGMERHPRGGPAEMGKGTPPQDN